MNEFGIVYLLPDEVCRYHRGLRQKIEAAFNLTGSIQLNAPPHITLKYRFSALDIQEVDQHLQTFSNMQVKTPWAIKGFNFFQNATKFVIFMDIIPSQAMRQAHRQLLDSLREVSWMQWGEFDHAELHYHVTLAHKGLTAENFNRVWAFVSQLNMPNFELLFDNVAVLQINEGFHTVYKQYWLSGDDSNLTEKVTQLEP